MKSILAIVSGVGFLIMLYLFLANGDKTVKIIETLASNSVSGIRTLQGR